MSGKKILPCQNRPLTVHCSGLGGELLSPEYEYDIFFQNHSQTKVYGPSLAIRPPHPTWVTAVRQIFRCYHPQGKLLFLRACFPQYVTVPVPVPEGIRDVDVLGFSAGSYTGLAIHEVLNEFGLLPGYHQRSSNTL